MISAVTVALSNVGRGGVELDAGTRFAVVDEAFLVSHAAAGAHDGFRILAFKDQDTCACGPATAATWSSEFVAITAAMRALPFKRIMLDGEAVAHCLDGLPHFHRLLGDGQATACFYAFDLLWLEAQDVRG